jgi:hypothetical protein
LEMGKVYDVIFDSRTRFHLKIDGPGQHVQIPYDILPSPSGPHAHMITKGQNRWLCRDLGKYHHTLSMRTVNGSSTQSPGRSAGSHQRMYGGATVDIFGMVCRSSWSGVMVLSEKCRSKTGLLRYKPYMCRITLLLCGHGWYISEQVLIELCLSFFFSLSPKNRWSVLVNRHLSPSQRVPPLVL